MTWDAADFHALDDGFAELTEAVKKHEAGVRAEIEQATMFLAEKLESKLDRIAVALENIEQKMP